MHFWVFSVFISTGVSGENRLLMRTNNLLCSGRRNGRIPYMTVEASEANPALLSSKNEAIDVPGQKICRDPENTIKEGIDIE